MLRIAPGALFVSQRLRDSAFLFGGEMLQRVFTVLMLLIVVACQPIGPMPGGELGGAVKPVPTEWGELAKVETVQLETRPDSPYSVNIWGVALGANYYVAAGSGETSWTKHIAADANVRLRAGESIFELRAVHVTEAAELEQVRAAYSAKYEMSDDQKKQSGQATVYRLDRR